MNLPWQSVEPLAAKTFAEVRRTAIFECCKWDPQVEDVGTLSPQPLVLTSEAWSEISGIAEKLASETVAAETAILQEHRHLRNLGLPWRLRRKFDESAILRNQSRHLRLMRFDFHFTTGGWRISEVNSDVPGGFNEASGFSRLIGLHYDNVAVPGDPAAEIVHMIGESVPPSGTVALIHATAFSDDRQVMVFLARKLQAAGLKPVLAAPDHLHWENGRATLATDWARGPVDFIFRFFPTEWLPALPGSCAWPHLIGDSQTPLCNPASAIVSQSKRFPLLWKEVPTALPVWNARLPRTYDVRNIDKGIPRASLVFKPVFGRVGDLIKIDGLVTEKERRAIDRSIRRHPRMWIAQEKFEAVPLQTAYGDFFPCIGVYTLNSRVIGAYGRMARRPLIDHLAQDTAVLVAQPKQSAKPNITTTSHDTSRTLQTVGA